MTFHTQEVSENSAEPFETTSMLDEISNRMFNKINLGLFNHTPFKDEVLDFKIEIAQIMENINSFPSAEEVTEELDLLMQKLNNGGVCDKLLFKILNNVRSNFMTYFLTFYDNIDSINPICQSSCRLN